MKARLFAIIFVLASVAVHAQKEEEKSGFQKDRLFTGGSISLSFFNGGWLIGGNPVFGYSITNWADLGLVGNYTYTSFRDYYVLNDKLKQSVYGGGVFTRIFPVHFLFAQAQVEHNWIRLKYEGAPGYMDDSYSVDGNSVLVGGGFANGRSKGTTSMYGYVAILFDVTKEKNSPYVDNQGRALPIIRAGVHIPLFAGRSSF